MKDSLFDLNLTKGVETKKSDLNPQTASVVRTAVQVSKRYCAGITLTCGCKFGK